MTMAGKCETRSQRKRISVGKRAQCDKEMKKYEMGVRLTQRQAILAKCFECANGYFDGKEDCAIAECPLHHLCHTGRKTDQKTLLYFWNPWFFGVGGTNILLPMIDSGLTIIFHEEIKLSNPPGRPAGSRCWGAPELPLLPGASVGGGCSGKGKRRFNRWRR